MGSLGHVAHARFQAAHPALLQHAPAAGPPLLESLELLALLVRHFELRAARVPLHDHELVLVLVAPAQLVGQGIRLVRLHVRGERAKSLEKLLYHLRLELDPDVQAEHL